MGVFRNVSLLFSSLSDINALQNWNVCNGINFSFIFKGCSLSDIKPLNNWKKVNNYLVNNLGEHMYNIKDEKV